MKKGLKTMNDEKYHICQTIGHNQCHIRPILFNSGSTWLCVCARRLNTSFWIVPFTETSVNNWRGADVAQYQACHGCVSVRGAWTHSPNCAPHSNERSPLHLTLEAWTVTGRRHAVCVIAQGGLKGCWEPGNSESLRNFGIGCTMYIQLASGLDNLTQRLQQIFSRGSKILKRSERV